MIRSLHHRRVKVGYSQRGYGTKPIEMTSNYRSALSGWASAFSRRFAAGGTAPGKNVELGDVVTVKQNRLYSLFRATPLRRNGAGE